MTFRKFTTISLWLLTCYLFLGCIDSETIQDPSIASTNNGNGDYDRGESMISSTTDFNKYWYAGNAEINRYELRQARYGEIHKGDAVLIFVTEDFLADRQVKFEGGEISEDKLSVLKLNFTRKFNTGIYPYSMMSSIFTPVNLETPTLKVATSNQEWCGHTFAQLNRRGNTIEGQLFSYFMSEGDEKISLKNSLLEDELWTRIRIDPQSLPTGDIELIPGTQFLRLKHREFKVEQANAKYEANLIDSITNKAVISYSINYKDFNRELKITFEENFPYAILSWTETGDAGFGQPGNLTTTAVRTHVIKEAYWSQNSVADSTFRVKLGLKD